MTSESRERFAAVVRTAPHRLDIACLLVAAESLPADRRSAAPLDRFLDAGLAALDDLAARVPAHGRPDQRLRAALEPFHGEPDDYALLESSLLPEVLRRRRGLPILLSTVWTEVARRAGVAAYGVGLPGHFVVGVGDPTTFDPDAMDGSRLLVDPWRGGTLLPYDAARDLVERSGQVFRRAQLAPHDPNATVSRVLTNIRTWAAAPLRAPVRLWAVELALLLPRHDVALRRERGRALLDLGAYGEAVRALDDYADLIEPLDPDEGQRARRLAARARAGLN
ncbi:MAG: transglutaminase-like domain-containing protein [Candidatus Nanopelagicales bacterium]